MNNKFILTGILFCVSFLLQAQFTANISGQLNNKTGGSGGIQKVNYRWEGKAGSVLLDSGKGFFMSNSAGVISGSVNIPSSAYTVYFILTMKNCDSLTVIISDSCSAFTPNISFTMRTCGFVQLKVSGSMQDHWKKPTPYAQIYLRYDSGGSPAAQILDTFLTDSVGVFYRTYDIPAGWSPGKVRIRYGCNGEMNQDSQTYQLFAAQNGDRVANVSFWQKNYCRLKGPRAVFSGYIKDSSNNPVPYFTFLIRADSVFFGDSMVFSVKTNASGYYADSISIDSSKASLGWQYRLITCGQNQVYSGRTMLVNKIARTQYNITNCGLYDWNLSIGWWGLTGNPNDSPDVKIFIADTLGNPLDSFVSKILSNTAGGLRTVPYQYPFVNVYMKYQSCNGMATSGNIRASRTDNDIWNFDPYPYCPNINIRVRLKYQNDTMKYFTGRLYLIRVTTQLTGSVLDTILTAVDSAAISAKKLGQFSPVTGGTYYVKFAPVSADPDYAHILPTYMATADSPVYWKDATAFTGTVKDSTYERTIMVRTGTNPGGPGFIGGSLASGANKKSNPIAGVDIILLNSAMQPVAFVSSNGSGQYSFSDVALGTWYILVDVPGRTATPRMVVLTSGSSSFSNVNFLVHKKYIENSEKEGISVIQAHKLIIYPNPANRELILDLEDSEYQVSIYDIRGLEVLDTEVSGKLIRMDVASLSPGVYLLRTCDRKRQSVAVRKLIVE